MLRIRKILSKLSSLDNMSLQRFVFLFTMSAAFTALYIQKVNPQLTFFSHRAIGNAVVNGIDSKIYVAAFYASIAIFFAVFWAGNLALNVLRKITAGRTLDYEYSLVFDFSFIALINMIIFMYDVFQSKIVQPIPYIVFAAFAFVILHAVLNAVLPKRFAFGDTDTAKSLWVSVVFLLPVFVTYAVMLLMSYGRSDSVMLRSPKCLMIYAVSYMITRLLIRSKPLISAVSRALVPLSFLPVTYIAANEIQYTLSKHDIPANPQKLALIFSAVLIVIAVLILIQRKSYRFSESESLARVKNFVLPALLVTMSLFLAHSQKITPIFDFLHQGNLTVPAQQLYQFGAIPCIDYWAPTHWPVGAYIYALFNGFNFNEIIIGNGIFEAIALTLVCYFILRKFTGGTFAAVLICFTPMLAYMNLYYCSGLLPMLYFDTVRQNKRVRDYAVVAILALVSFGFMASSGKIAVLTSIVMIIFSCSNRKDFVNAAIGFLGVMLVSGIIYFTLVILRGETIIDRIKLIQAIADCDIEIGAYWSLIGRRSSPFEIITCYGVLPCISIVALIFALRVKEKSKIHYALIYLLIASLVGYLRAFARHALIENNQTIFFPFVLCVLPLVFIKHKTFKKFALFVIILSLVYAPYISWKKGEAQFNGNHGIADGGVKNFEFVTWKPGDSRCDTAGNAEYPKNLRAVLDSVLDKGQTFLRVSMPIYFTRLWNVKHRFCIIPCS